MAKALDLTRVMAKIDGLSKDLKAREARVGWFPGAKYEDGTSVAYIATVQEFGGTFEHPGGTAYRIKADGMAEFLTSGERDAARMNGGQFAETKAHAITIPPRPFMRPTVQDKQATWTKKVAAGIKKVVRGEMTIDQVMGAVGMLAVGDIVKTIAKGDFKELSAATLAQRRAKGQGNKPLQASGQLIATINSEVDDPS